jgi:putative spermidine/putrescine transport system ATP-binding protein
MSFLKLENLSKQYGDFHAVTNIDLSVEQGEFVSLLGPSGCGKTTTLQMIAGFVEASAGRILLNGRDITHEKPNRRGLGIVFQSYALFPHMTVSDNVRFGLEMRHVDAKESAQRVEQALALVHLEKFAHRYPRELSGGQRQRVALARALVIEPPILLLDEPMSNLDAKLREEMQVELRDIQRKVGTTTIMVTHDQAEALSMSDRVVVMEAGRAVQIGKPLDTYENPVNRFVSQFVGKANLLEADIVWQRPGKVGLRIGQHELEVDTDTTIDTPQATICIRPEKIERCSTQDAMLTGEVASCFFLGNQWLYRIHTECGDILAIWQNDGQTACQQGQSVALRWPASATRLLNATLQEAHV